MLACVIAARGRKFDFFKSREVMETIEHAYMKCKKMIGFYFGPEMRSGATRAIFGNTLFESVFCKQEQGSRWLLLREG